MSTKTDHILSELDKAYCSLFKLAHKYWKHYKGGVYSVEGIAFDTAAGEATVIYRRIDGPNFDMFTESEIKYTRLYSEWLSTVEVDGVTQQRFVPVYKKEFWVDRNSHLPV